MAVIFLVSPSSEHSGKSCFCTAVARERERELNLKTLFDKDCSLISVKTLSNN